MQLSKAVDGYVISSLAEGYSPLTLNAYKSALFTMIEYLGDKEVSRVNTDDLKGFMSYLVMDYPRTQEQPTEYGEDVYSHNRAIILILLWLFHKNLVGTYIIIRSKKAFDLIKIINPNLHVKSNENVTEEASFYQKIMLPRESAPFMR
jgi:hypothetical protein